MKKTFLNSVLAAVIAVAANSLSVEASVFGDVDFEFQNGDSFVPFDALGTHKKNYWDSSEAKQEKLIETIVEIRALDILDTSWKAKEIGTYQARNDFVDIFMEIESPRGTGLVTFYIGEKNQLSLVLRGFTERDLYFKEGVMKSIDDLPDSYARGWSKAIQKFRDKNPTFFSPYFDLKGLYIYEAIGERTKESLRHNYGLIGVVNLSMIQNDRSYSKVNDPSKFVKGNISQNNIILKRSLDFQNKQGQVFDFKSLNDLKELAFIKGKGKNTKPAAKKIINLSEGCKIYHPF